jgi:integrase
MNYDTLLTLIVFGRPRPYIGHLLDTGASMARRIKDATLDSKEARRKLTPRGKPYYRQIERGLHLGYRRLAGGGAGTWVARHYIGYQDYQIEKIAIADDLSDADGVAVLDFWQAQALARDRMRTRVHTAAGKTGPLTVSAAMDAYLEFLEANRKTAGDARYKDAAFIRPKLGEIEVEALTTQQLRQWLSDLAKQAPRLRTKKGSKQRHREFENTAEAKRRRQATANRILTILRAALNQAWREGLAPSDIAWRRVKPFEHVEASRLRYLSIAEAKRLINACDEDFRPLVEAALQTGARYGELAALTVADFNPDSGTTKIRQSKTGKPRHVVLTDEGIALFGRLSAGRSGNQLMFGKEWKPSQQLRPMAEAVNRAKIKPAISFHGLRHTWASLAIMNGMPLMVVARNLGHTTTRMVERHYGHLRDEYVATEVRKNAPRFGIAPSKVETIR